MASTESESKPEPSADEPLTPEQNKELAYREGKFEEAAYEYVQHGEALRDIRNGRLYRGQHNTFAEYCENRWNKSLAEAEAEIDAAAIYRLIEERPGPRFCRLPFLEEVRHLAKLRKERGLLDVRRIRQTWRWAVKSFLRNVGDGDVDIADLLAVACNGKCRESLLVFHDGEEGEEEG